MTIKDMELRTGMTRANIRFYEKEGLLLPQREENGYRDYTEADQQELEKIKLLRMLEVPLDQIRLVQSGQRTLSIVLEKQLAQLSQEKAQLDRVQTVCQQVFDAGTSYATLDAEHYLNALEKQPLPDTDTLPRLYAPWRRYYARLLDSSLCSVLLYGALALCTTISLWDNTVLDLAGPILIALLVLLMEPFLLHWFGTTPGKWILGLRVTRWDGTKLSYNEALNRTANVLHCGTGWGVPLYGEFCSIRCYQHAKDEQIQPWESDNVQTLKDKKAWRIVAYLLCFALVFLLLGGILLYSIAPHHRGGLTVKEFAENFNTVSRSAPDTPYAVTLDENGQFYDDPHSSYPLLDNFVLSYDVQDGVIHRIRYEITDDEYPEEQASRYYDILETAMISFVQAQAGIPFVYHDQTRYATYQLETYPLENWQITANDIHITQEVSFSVTKESGHENDSHLHLILTMEKQS